MSTSSSETAPLPAGSDTLHLKVTPDDNNKILSTPFDNNKNHIEALESPAPQDGGVIGWLVVLASFSIYVTVVGFQYVVGLLYNAWLDDFESFPGLVDRRATLGWACSVQAGTFLGGSMISGIIIKKSSERFCLWISALLALIGGFGSAFATPIHGDGQVNAAILIFFFGFVLGCCCSFGSLTAIVGVQSYFVQRRGIATGLVVAGSGFGALIQGPLIQMAIERYGWRGALVIYSIVTATILILSSLAFVPMKQRTAKSSHRTTTNSPSTSISSTTSLSKDEEDLQADVVRQKSFVRALANPAIVDEEADTAGKTSVGGLASLATVPDWEEAMASIKATEGNKASNKTSKSSDSDFPPLSLYMLSTIPSFQAYTLFIGLYAFVWFSIPGHFARSAVEAGATAEQAALLVSTQGIGNTCGRIALGLSVDLFPKHKTTIISLAVLSLSIGMLLLSIPEAARSVPYLYFFMAICGSLGGSIVSLQPALIIEMVGMRNLSLAQGVFNSFQSPFALMSAPSVGALRNLFGNYTPFPWLVVSLISFTAFGLSLRISRAMNK
jgi:MFS family permease